MKDPYSIPKAMRETFTAISALTDAFCAAKLNDEYAEMCRQMIAKLSRKRPSPLDPRRPKQWAAGVVHAVGTVNFAFDKNQDPHIKVPDISSFFAVGKDAPAAKSKVIRDIFHIRLMDPDWTLPSRIDDNPMVWYIMVDGIIIDARHAPFHIQEIAYEKGMIPYIPYLKE